MKRHPAAVIAYDLDETVADTTVAIPHNGRTAWVRARPLTFTRFSKRVKMAFDVFKGRADALYWPGQN